jgi:hypothetical protein
MAANVGTEVLGVPSVLSKMRPLHGLKPLKWPVHDAIVCPVLFRLFSLSHGQPPRLQPINPPVQTVKHHHETTRGLPNKQPVNNFLSRHEPLKIVSFHVSYGMFENALDFIGSSRVGARQH